VLARNGERPATDATVNGALKVRTGKREEPSKPNTIKPQALRAEFVGNHVCKAAGVVVKANAPALALCRQLLAQGVDPDAALQIYRNGTLALRIRSIADGAALTVEDDRFGKPVFRWNRALGAGMASLARQTRRGGRP
jgi:hypothetical protein